MDRLIYIADSTIESPVLNIYLCASEKREGIFTCVDFAKKKQFDRKEPNGKIIGIQRIELYFVNS
jgi:hypothetical protein